MTAPGTGPDVDAWAREASDPVAPSMDDAEASFDIRDGFRRFNQRNDIFCRAFWDAGVRSRKTEVFYETYRRPLTHHRPVEGYGQRDYAFRNAAWHVPDVFAEMKEDEDRREGFLDAYSVLRDGYEERRPVASPEAMTAELKRVARACGADLVGVARFDERWVYSHRYSAHTQQAAPVELPPGLTSVVVVATAMDYDLVRTVPSALSGAATGLGYARDVVTVLSTAQFIRNLGYRAVPSLNDTALAIPFAIKAGLGEYGRHGLLITKEFGPRVRLGKIFTDLPLVPDRAVTFGVKRFCDACRRCTRACPPGAIPDGEPSDVTHNVSNVGGVVKWTVDAERCFSFWAGQNSDCSICIRVCPYNRDSRGFGARLFRLLAGTRLRGLALRLDGWLGRGRRKPARWWWRA